MVEQGVEWPPEMRRVRVTVFERVTQDIVDTFRAIQGRDKTPETCNVRFAILKGYDESHESLMTEVFDMVKKPDV